MIATPIHIPLHTTRIRSFYETTTKPLTDKMATITMCNPNHNPINTLGYLSSIIEKIGKMFQK